MHFSEIEGYRVDLGDNLSDSYAYTKKLFSGASRLIILIVLSVIPIVDWIVLGYMAKVLKESPGPGTPPKLEDYSKLFVDGAKVFFATFIYMLIPTILIVIGALGTFPNTTSFQSPMVAPALSIGGAGVVILLVGIILGVLLLIVLAVGLAHMIKTDKFGNAFAFGEIFGIVRSIGWLRYLAWLVLVVVIGSVFGILSIIPFVGAILAAIVQPIYYVFVFRSLGLLYNDGAPAELKVQGPIVTGLACASCGTSLQPQHKFCPNCGAAAPTPPASTQSETKFCISCGAKIPATANFCGSCGAKQT
jgi:hypothetical protein